MSDGVRSLWARTRVRSWPDTYVLASLPPGLLEQAARLAGSAGDGFVALLREQDEVSLVIPSDLWQASPLRKQRRAEAGRYRVLTFDIDLDLDLVGYLAPLAARLAKAGISIVPLSGYLKDHLLVQEEDQKQALEVTEAWIAECRGTERTVISEQ